MARIAHQNAFALLLLTIVSISFYDAYLVIEYQESIMDNEWNPVGLVLLEAGDGTPDLFVSAKLFGTLVVMYSLLVMKRKYKRAMLVTSCVAFFQVALLIFLWLDPRLYQY